MLQAAFDMIPTGLAHHCMRLVYRISCWWVNLRGRPLPGVAVAVWHGGELLVVQPSYRRGYALPGGLIGRREEPVEAACRELREEVGIHARPHELVLITEGRAGRFDDCIFEYRPVHRPRIRIDRWEIAAARFVDPAIIADMDESIASYLRRFAVAPHARPAAA